jgi:hypothetical protein
VVLKGVSATAVELEIHALKSRAVTVFPGKCFKRIPRPARRLFLLEKAQ